MTDDLWASCTVPGCGGVPWARGLCPKHYGRWYRHGDPLVGKDEAPRGAASAFLELAIQHEGGECLAWPFGRKAAGYGRIAVGGVMKYVHRLVCEAVYGPPPAPEHQAAHSCGNGHLGCVNPRHLRWATPKENEADKFGHGTALVGERHPKSKLTNAERLEIQSQRGQRSQRELAELYGVSPSAIGRVLNSAR